MSLFKGPGCEQKRCHTVQLSGDLSVWAGEQFAYTPLDAACHALAGREEKVNAAARAADPVPVIPRAGAADLATGATDADQRADFLTAGAGGRIAPEVLVARSAHRSERQCGLDRYGPLAQDARPCWAYSATAG
jgi:hypothetical protein